MVETVVLAVLDSMRYDVFKEYIQKNPDSFLSNIKSNSVSFKRATAAAPWSLPSHASIFTGLDPEEHGALRAETRIGPNIKTILDHFPKEVETGCFTANAFISPEYGFSGWDEYKFFRSGEPFPSASPGYDRSDMNLTKAIVDISTSSQSLKQFINSAYRLSRQTRFGKFFDDGGSRITANSISWLESLSQNKPAFLFLNYLETHDRHKYLSSWEKRLKCFMEYSHLSNLNNKIGAEYYFNDEEITKSDKEKVKELMMDELNYVGRLLSSLRDALERQNRLKDTMFIICADHGDGLGEQGIAYHLVGVTEPVLRIPMLIYTQGSEPNVIKNRVSLSWLQGTILEWLGKESSVNLLDPSTYPDYVSAVNTKRIKDVTDGREIDPELLANRRVVYESKVPTKKYRRINNEDTIWKIETSGLSEKQVGKGGTQKFDEYLSGISIRSNREQAEMSDRTRSALKDLGYL